MPVEEENIAALREELYSRLNDWLPAELKNSVELNSILQSALSSLVNPKLNNQSVDRSKDDNRGYLPGLEAVLHASHNGVLIVDREGRIRFVNKKAADKLGWSSGINQKGFVSADLHVSDQKPKDGNSILDIQRSCPSNKSAQRIEYPSGSAGQKIHLLVNISEISDSMELLYVVSIRDISKEVDFEQELQRQKKFTEDVLNNLPADIAVFDKNHHYLFLNPSAIKDKATREWIIGKTDYDYCKWKGKSTELADERRAYFKQCLETGERVQYVDKLQDATGQTRHILRNFYPYPENGTVKYVFGYAIDVTEIKETQERLNDTLLSLESINSELEHIAYIISHDLQEPLRMVKSFIQLLEMKLDPVLDETDRKYLGFAKSGTDRMKIHIKDLLDYSRIGKKQEQLQETPLTEVLDELKIIFQLSISESNTEIVSGNLPVIRCYREGIYHLLQNLLENAIKYRDPAKSKNIIHVSCEEHSDNWLLKVKDNGVGVDPKYFQKIFMLFQRLDGDKSGQKGTGVGLAICKKIVELHKGSIRLESQPGEGTVFIITIPKNID